MKELDGPLVSIIMPVYNGERYIEAAIRSVLEQTYRNLELLIINDGSNDGTEKIVLVYSGRDRRIRYFSQANRGVSSARNFGLKNMRGSYFAFLDCDDMLPRESIDIRIRRFRKDETLMFCDGRVVVFDHDPLVEKRSWMPSFTGVPFKRLCRLSESCFFGPTWLIKRDASLNYMFDEDLTHAEDLFFFMTIAQYGRYDYVQNTILNYRSSDNSAMSNLTGLANGYFSLYDKMLSAFPTSTTSWDRLWLWLRIRRIMILSFLSKGHWLNAFRILIGRSVK